VIFRTHSSSNLVSATAQAPKKAEVATFQINLPTTSCKLKDQLVDTSNLPDALNALALAQEGSRSLPLDLFKELDLSHLEIDDLERLVYAAMKGKVALSGCGISEESAHDLIRRAEVHCRDNQSHAEPLKAALQELRIIQPPRDIQLSIQAPAAPEQSIDLNVGVMKCKTTRPIPPGEELVASTTCLKTCTAVAVITKDTNANRIVTLSHAIDYSSAIENHVGLHHSPGEFELDHEIIIVTPGYPFFDRKDEWGIRSTIVRTGFELQSLTPEGPCIPRTTQKSGPRWFANAKTTLIVYPENQKKTLGATFTLHVPADANQPVKFSLKLS
jgi:hypothetical protein